MIGTQDWVQDAMQEAWAEAKRRRSLPPKHAWPTVYTNRETGRAYTPHSEEEARFVYLDNPPFPIVTGGEGAGKSVAGSIFTLERIKWGMSGIVVSPTLPHFASSTWMELRRWIPWEFVARQDQYMQDATWTPTKQFQLVFDLPGQPYLELGGLVDNRGKAVKWEGPNVGFAWFDEARRAQDASGLKVLIGRARIPGPKGEKPQVALTTTGGCPWLTEYYGPRVEHDPHSTFKDKTRVVQLLTSGNLANLSADYVENRGSILSDAEKDIYLGADPWGSVSVSPFIEDMNLWDRLREVLPPLGNTEPVVLALDAAVSGDSFGLGGVSRHPDKARYNEHVVVRFALEWKPAPGQKLDYDAAGGPFETVRRLCKDYNIICVVYDPYQMHYAATRFAQEGIAWFYEFSQGDKRLEADADLLTMITQKRLAHDGTHSALREHIQNADRKLYTLDSGDKKIRLIKRQQGLKIDLAVCLSMASYQCLQLNL